ncbi:hypothetical protein E2C01_046030 [Portunus trituberculatus]|uniref:Uncharacterized protein n=1 Tax=Portunus trituberculatus TaxID=210409 RepID=A0A5B7G4Q0_PORTR|nr:hypothetical protein [Portunus trituberculatus]
MGDRSPSEEKAAGERSESKLWLSGERSETPDDDTDAFRCRSTSNFFASSRARSNSSSSNFYAHYVL